MATTIKTDHVEPNKDKITNLSERLRGSPKLTVYEFETFHKVGITSKCKMMKVGSRHYIDLTNLVTYRLTKGHDATFHPQNKPDLPKRLVASYRELNAKVLVSK